MHYRKHRSKIDINQNAIVKALRKIPGVTVQTGMDDLLVGHLGMTYWFEIKQGSPYKQGGELKKGALKDSQIKLMNEWQGHYSVIWSLGHILKEIGIND